LIQQLHAAATEPWERLPADRAGRISVIGGGIAAATIAAALTRRGREVTLIERHPTLAAEGSGNPVGIVMPRPAAGDEAETRFFARAFRHAVTAYPELTQGAFKQTGVLQLAQSAREHKRLAAFLALGLLDETHGRLVGEGEAGRLVGLELPAGGLWSAQGGLLQPRLACEQLTRGITRLQLGAAALRLVRMDPKDGEAGWQIDIEGGQSIESESVIIANALEATQFEATSWLPLSARRGQITLAEPEERSAGLRAALVFGGYMTPPVEGRHCIGATFDHADPGPQAVSSADHLRNLAALTQALGDILPKAASGNPGGRAALRAVTPDHLPLAGPVPDRAAWLEDYAPLARNAHRRGLPAARWIPGLYVMSGLGPRGLTVAPLLAEMLAAQICGEESEVPAQEARLLQPGRFIIRQLKRQAGGPKNLPLSLPQTSL
jgi:tRNA 5-methylaminomethyl-2-thiouridine biosynthesis bifunctional protein